jgi:hypothetical protein
LRHTKRKYIEMFMGNILIKKFTQGRRDARVSKSLAFRLTTGVHL